MIIEATSVCDLKCSGCYAPNVTTKEDANSLLQKTPSLFLLKDRLAASLQLVEKSEGKISSAAIRGGEPTKHPLLSEILALVSQSIDSVFLETHGRWILADTEATRNILASCRSRHITLKLSFDKMHGLSTEKLRAITNKLSSLGNSYLIAITESSIDDFLRTRRLCDWLSDDQIIFQKKAFLAKELIQPKMGVIRVNGTWTNGLSTKATFSGARKEVAV